VSALAALLALQVALAVDTVPIRGNIQHTGSGEIRLELLTWSRDGEPPLLAWAGTLPGAGPFEVEVPAELGLVVLRAAVDLERDGIGPDDPQGVFPATLPIGRDAILGLELTLTRPEDSRTPGADATRHGE
jgi:hypothetical protein